jgi:uncharacterized protein YhaN
MELEDLDRDREASAARLAALETERRSLAAERTSADLRLQRAQLEAQIAQGAAEWWALELADQALADVRGEFERTCQPVTLADASRYFSRLTCGQYRNVWTPLGERRLCVEDEQRRTIPVEHLSRGTREQLFLAIRLALVQDLARRGSALPLVLDDVLVNFDERRTAAAAEVLQEFAARGVQVLLFTSHCYLADSFAARGLEPVALPLPVRAGGDQPWERRAG